VKSRSASPPKPWRSTPHRHRLGMGKMRGELEDLAFKYLEPEASAELLKEFETARPPTKLF